MGGKKPASSFILQKGNPALKLHNFGVQVIKVQFLSDLCFDRFFILCFD
jgi:hypothetical protein